MPGKFIITTISKCERSDQFFQTASEATSLDVTKRSHPKCVSMSVCVSVSLSVRPSVFYLLLNHMRDQNENFRGCRHQALDGYYILKTYCYKVNFKVICEKPVPRLILVAHIQIGTGDPLIYLLSPLLLPTS